MDYRRALEVAIAAARDAGDLLRADFHRPGGPRHSSPHKAHADTEAEHRIWAHLEPLGMPGVGEETAGLRGADTGHVWVVDPNDGTAAYIRGHRGSAVSIALVRDGVPVVGVVFAFAYPDDDGDLIAWAEGAGPITRNGEPVAPALTDRALGPAEVVLVSQDADRLAGLNATLCAPARFRAMPSIAYRLALAAVGEGAAGVSSHGPNEIDYAAGVALVRASGGIVIDGSGHEVRCAPGSGGAGVCLGGAPAAVKALASRDWQAVRRAAKEPIELARLEPGHAIADAALLRRAQGCLLGQLAGDSLGSLVEFMGPSEIARQYPQGVRALADGGVWGTLAGQPTDDSELALALARSLVARGGFDPAHVQAAYLAWGRSGPFDIGTTTRAALDAAAKGRPIPAESQANGALMRVSPLGILGAGRPTDAVAWARSDAALTHAHPVCQAASAAFVAAIATAIAGCDRSACHAAAVAAAGECGSIQDALERARTAAPEDFMHHQGWVLTALQNAFFELHHAPSLEEGLVRTVGRGGDTDTNGAIAGALLGAFHGRNALPAQWTTAILSCRPGLPTDGAFVGRPRPACYRPVDALELAERLLLTGQAR